MELTAISLGHGAIDKSSLSRSRSPGSDGRVDTRYTDQRQWFAAEVQTHEPHLRRWLQARFPALTDRDDLIQESFLRLMRAHAASPIANVRAYLFVTARNLALNHLRDRRHTHPTDVGDFDPTRVIDGKADIPEAVARNQELHLLQEALQALPERCREVFTLRRIHGVSQKEIAARLGISEKTVENQSVLALRRCVEFFRERRAGGRAIEEGGAK